MQRPLIHPERSFLSIFRKLFSFICLSVSNPFGGENPQYQDTLLLARGVFEMKQLLVGAACFIALFLRNRGLI
jgi:hypothetical protein